MIAGLATVHGGGRLPAHTLGSQEAKTMECEHPVTYLLFLFVVSLDHNPWAGTMHIWLNLPGNAILNRPRDAYAP